MRIRDASGWIMFIFGAVEFLFGLIGMIRPETLLALLGFEVVQPGERAASDYTAVFIIAASMTYFNIGTYFVLAALHDLRIFYRWTVPFRMLTFLVFTTLAVAGMAPFRFIAVGTWELVGALATGAALYTEDRARPKTTQKLTE